MNEVIGLMAGQLSGWDFLIAGGIVAVVEYLIKKLICKDSEKYLLLYKVAPIVLGGIVYLILAIVQKTSIPTGLFHGLGVGLASMGSYDIILKTIKESGVKSLETTNNAIKEVMEKK